MGNFPVLLLLLEMIPVEHLMDLEPKQDAEQGQVTGPASLHVAGNTEVHYETY